MVVKNRGCLLCMIHAQFLSTELRHPLEDHMSPVLLALRRPADLRAKETPSTARSGMLPLTGHESSDIMA